MTKKPESSFVGAQNLRFLNSEKNNGKNSPSPSSGNRKPETGNLKWAHGECLKMFPVSSCLFPEVKRTGFPFRVPCSRNVVKHNPFLQGRFPAN